MPALKQLSQLVRHSKHILCFMPLNTHSITAVRRAQRIIVVGASATGKSTLCRRLSAGLELPYTELDSLFHGPNWTPLPRFLDDVTAISASERWVSEWQYRTARPILLERATLIIWLNLPVWQQRWQLIRRTLHRRKHSVELWNGNVEPPLHTILTDREHIIRYSWNGVRRYARLVEQARTQRPDIPVVELRSHAHIDALTAALAEHGDS